LKARGWVRCGLTVNQDAGKPDTLAAAYAVTGQFGDAVGVAKEAIRLAKGIRWCETGRRH
jgi:hypothetical protein